MSLRAFSACSPVSSALGSTLYVRSNGAVRGRRRGGVSVATKVPSHFVPRAGASNRQPGALVLLRSSDPKLSKALGADSIETKNAHSRATVGLSVLPCEAGNDEDGLPVVEPGPIQDMGPVAGLEPLVLLVPDFLCVVLVELDSQRVLGRGEMTRVYVQERGLGLVVGEQEGESLALDPSEARHC